MAELNIDQEWENFMSGDYESSSDDENLDYNAIMEENPEFISVNINDDINCECPKASSLYISTKTKISYLNQTVNLKTIFWKIPVISYSLPKCGVIKKQFKINSNTPEELDEIKQNLENVPFYEEYIIKSINNPTGRIKFKDSRKISIGISKKDITSYKFKKKGAFYNCFVLILRLKIDVSFKEYHVKVFNTGKLEIPGIKTDEEFNVILKNVIDVLQPYFEETLEYKKDTEQTVLINSNFNCGFYIDRDQLYNILKCKYNLQCIYDKCSYPGVQCKSYYDDDNKNLITSCDRTKVKISFMIFRTGSVLIVGKCDNESIIERVYNFLKDILTKEFKTIASKLKKDGDELEPTEKKPKKTRRKILSITVDN